MTLANDVSQLTVAAAQVHSRLCDIDANLHTHLEVIDAARAAQVDCLLFPELSLVGHSAGPEALTLALETDHAIVRRLAQAAGPMAVTFGMIEEGPAAQFYNSAITVQNGNVVHVHRKINLATFGALDDGKHFAAGRYIETFALAPHWRVATLICNDIWSPALVHLAALHGATLLLAPVSSAREAVGAEFDNPGGWDTACRYTAMVYGLPIIFSNRTGVEHGLNFWGGSRIVGPHGKTLVHANDADQMIVATLDYAELRRARYLLPTARDSNLALMAREIQRLEAIIGVPSFVRD